MSQARVIQRLGDEVVRLDWSFGFQWVLLREKAVETAQPIVYRICRQQHLILLAVALQWSHGN
jgi:hypothetical protein